MARKGSTKVRTGCSTCKIRKVKCDEGKPHCQRCISTGRKCDGYVQATTSSDLTWHRPRHLFPGVDNVEERRALQFFCQAAGPSLSGPMDPYFWTHLVMQFCNFEPAVRHSVVAISSLYERMKTRSQSAQRPVDNRFALSHYNSAIRELKSMNNEPLVLLVCILFVCIEFLQDNQGAAIQHCKHGVSILKNAEAAFPWTKEYLSPIFRRLTIFPFFFALDETSFPKLINLEDQVPESFASFEEAQYFIDGVLLRTIRLVRSGDCYRLGDMHRCPVSRALLVEQDNTRVLLNDWNDRFSDLRNRPSTPTRPEEMLCSIFLRYEIARIWVETAFEYDETVYDKYIGRFRLMVATAAKLNSAKALKPDNSRGTRKFIFEMGFVPLLYYIVMKCRCLKTRIEALSLMKRLGVAKENLWEVSTMHAVGRRIVEIEHDVLLDEKDNPFTTPVWPGLPPDEMRVRDSTTRPALSMQVDARDQEIRGRMAGFYRRTVEGDIYLQTDFVAEII
ncbi:hypothetical protein F5Y00DRAFT_274396 [Daldinia vernicosa]|uniref:uncharacterized protein n=1 Tax=Daldinia vernicosa TaxID=114800 RepID=UPI0020075661|nr:uncharacterized protein F5Y00DRAFT_274396 [Daldinia vernicosa]KAI0844246.1 hypothetical protein F5Y00DRAFT_274396 [Daldinia vernicosa]